LWSHRDIGWKGHVVQHPSRDRMISTGPTLVLSSCVLKTSKHGHLTSSRFSKVTSCWRFFYTPTPNIQCDSHKPQFPVAICCPMLHYLLLRKEFSSIMFITALEIAVGCSYNLLLPLAKLRLNMLERTKYFVGKFYCSRKYILWHMPHTHITSGW